VYGFDVVFKIVWKRVLYDKLVGFVFGFCVGFCGEALLGLGYCAVVLAVMLIFCSSYQVTGCRCPILTWKKF